MAEANPGATHHLDHLHQAGLRLYYQGRLPEAIAPLRAALDQARTRQNPDAEAATLVALAQVYNFQGQRETALDLVQQALEIYRGLEDPRGEASALRGVALAQPEENLDAAQDLLATALDLAEEAGTPLLRGMILLDIGAIHIRQRDTAAGLEQLQSAQAVLATASSEDEAVDYFSALTWVWIGSAHLQLEQPDRTLESLEPAFALSRDRDLRLIAGFASFVAGAAHQQAEDYDTAIEQYQQALVIFEASEVAAVVNARRQLATVYLAQDDPPKALKQLQLALAAVEQLRLGDRQRLEIWQGFAQVASQYISKGTDQLENGEISAALQQYEQAIAIWRQGLEPLQSLAAPELHQQYLLSLSLAHGILGEYHRRDSRYDQALEALKQGLAYGDQLLELESATADVHKQALDTLVDLYNTLGVTYSDQHRYAEAQAAHQQALDIARQLEDPALQSSALGLLYASYLFLNRYPEALAVNQERLTIAGALDDPERQLDALIGLGRTYDDMGHYPEALVAYERALPLAKAQASLRDEATILNNLSLIHSALGEYDEAIAMLDAAFALTQDLRRRLSAPDTPAQLDQDCFLDIDADAAGAGIASLSYDATASQQLCIEGTWLAESQILNTLASVYEDQGRYPEALTHFEAALAIAREQLQDSPLYSRHNEATFLNNLGRLHQSRGDYAQALAFYQQSLDIFTAIQDREGIAVGLNNVGAIYSNQGRYPDAIAVLDEALGLVDTLDLQVLRGNVLNNLGLVYHGQGDYGRTRDLYQQSLEIDQSLGRPAQIAVSLGNLGTLSFSRGDYTQAIDYTQQALDIHQTIGQRANEILDLTNLGDYYRTQGRYAEALKTHQQALALAQEIGNLSGEAYALQSLGINHRYLGQYTQALEFYRQALVLFQRMGDRTGEAAILADQGLIYEQQDQDELALEGFEAALAIDRAIGNVAAESITLQYIGFLQAKLGRYPAAEAAFEQALAIQQRIGARGFAGISLQGLGVTYTAQGDPQALDFLQQAVTRHREVGDRPSEASALNRQGAALLKLDQFSEAESVLRQSIGIFETLRSDLADDQLIALLDTQASAYTYLEQALIAQNQPTEALAASERGRARAFVLQLSSRLSDSDRADLAATEAPTIAEIQQTARDTDTTLVTYSLSFDQTLYIWVVQPSGQIEFRSVVLASSGDADDGIDLITALEAPIYRGGTHESVLQEQIVELRNSAIASPAQPPTSQLQALHQLLIDPIAELLPTDPEDKVVFIPQGSLFLVPFPALQDADGTYLIEKHTLLSAPSIQVFDLASELSKASAGQQGEPLLVGDPVMPSVWLPQQNREEPLPSLPGTRDEVEAIALFLNSPALTDGAATEARIKQLLPSASLIHLATHGLLEYGNPQSSGVLDLPGAVALAPGDGEDGLLTAAEILEMDLHADLAVLSACDTGRGRITGDGVVGLSRALITAGVPSVVVSLWAVPDAPTAELMTAFYEQLSQGQDKAQALRQAMLSTMARRPNPRDWAAFTLLGASE
ncbi:CHAT domain-containing tetratricopeptide repeat protein [Nodosilinea sp. LEGE 07088]|uniref:CHAT domain-containing tetratricopeptide repeat protein n=1 Tax=Nodosilinea sp. LEGE 07088 TaxID=2777968 RepID=UPI0028BE6BE5|nr:CHAT domain-containing tetratricopeptide repeat protein [Nodosilinea sp. LEGE 07088]